MLTSKSLGLAFDSQFPIPNSQFPITWNSPSVYSRYVYPYNPER